MKREVAELSGNFRGECPHLMRAQGFVWSFAVCAKAGNTRQRVRSKRKPLYTLGFQTFGPLVQA